MKKPPIPDNETERIQQLISYDILESAKEDEYDHITELASALANTPVALVSLVDVNRQWFKACYGISGLSETDRSISFCAHAINYKECLIVDDPLTDERFKNNPLVTGDMHVRFYAGFPLIDSSGFALGTLCVLDTKENSITEIQKKQLKMLSLQIVRLMELRKAHIVTKENYKELSILSQKNIDQQVQLKAALDESAKLSVIGELAASIVHEIKNSLFIIGSTSELLSSVCESENSPLAIEVKGSVEVIDSSLDRIDKIIKGLSKNSRTVKDEFRSVVVKEVINDCLAMLSGKMKKQKINILVDCDPEIKVKGRHSDLGQVIVNLISNSLDATFDIESNDKWIKIGAKEDGETIKISVTDCGKGIEKSVVDSLFTSFFTTKEVGKGTGLGLSISRKVIEEHGGELYYDEKCQNTSFVVKLKGMAS